MKIETKYNIGDRIWVVYEPIINNKYGQNQPAGEISVYADEISSIEIDEDGITYVLKDSDYTELKEDEIILYHETDKLLEKIQGLMHKINKREKENE